MLLPYRKMWTERRQTRTMCVRGAGRRTRLFAEKHIQLQHIICFFCLQIARQFTSVLLFVCESLTSLDGSTPILGALKSTSLSRHTWHRFSSADGTLAHEFLTTVVGLVLCSNKMTTSGHFADTHGLTGYDRHMTYCQFLFAREDTQNLPIFPKIVSVCFLCEVSCISPARSWRNRSLTRWRSV